MRNSPLSPPLGTHESIMGGEDAHSEEGRAR